MKKQIFKNIFNGILEGVQKETLEKYPDLIKGLSEFSNAEDFHMGFQYPVGNVLEAVLRAKYPVAPSMHKLIFIHEEYTYVEHFIEKFVIKHEGMACCADKSRYMTRQFELLFGAGKEIDITRKEGNEYWMPKCLTIEQWIEFFEAIYELWYGNALKYLQFVKDVEMRLASQIVPKTAGK